MMGLKGAKKCRPQPTTASNIVHDVRTTTQKIERCRVVFLITFVGSFGSSDYIGAIGMSMEKMEEIFLVRAWIAFNQSIKMN